MGKGKEVTCLSCGEIFELEEDVEPGDITCCVDCGQEFKVVRVDKPKLKTVVAFEADDVPLYAGSVYEDQCGPLGLEDELHEEAESNAEDNTAHTGLELDEELVIGGDELDDEREY